MVKKLPGVEKKVEKNFKKKIIWDKKWNKKMGGRICFITSGAFGDTLLSDSCLSGIILQYLGPIQYT